MSHAVLVVKLLLLDTVAARHNLDTQRAEELNIHPMALHSAFGRARTEPAIASCSASASEAGMRLLRWILCKG